MDAERWREVEKLYLAALSELNRQRSHNPASPTSTDVLPGKTALMGVYSI
jgi:hypothetical protein